MIVKVCKQTLFEVITKLFIQIYFGCLRPKADDRYVTFYITEVLQT